MTRFFLIVLLIAGCGDDGGLVDSGPGSDAGRDGATDAGPGSDSGSGGDLDDCFADFAPSRYAVVQTLATADGTIRIRTGSEVGDRMAVGETFAFDLKRFGITRDGTTTCITELSALAYDFGHHNWDETLSANSGGDRFEVTMQYDIIAKPPAWDDQLRIYDTGSTTPREGPLPLEDAGCYSIPSGDLNACLGRMRTDG